MVSLVINANTFAHAQKWELRFPGTTLSRHLLVSMVTRLPG